MPSMSEIFATSDGGHVHCWNVANLGIWLLNIGTLTLAFFNELPGEGNPQKVLIEKYPTLLTPNLRVLQIVPVVYGVQIVFVLFQLTPLFRNDPLVTLITPWWVATNLIHVQWIVELTRDTPGSIGYSLLCVFGMLGCLLGMILVVDARKLTFFQYWFLRAPFSLWIGWLLPCSIINLNMWAKTFDDPKFPNSYMLCMAMISLSFIFVITALFSLNTRRPDPLLCLPVAWFLYWIWQWSDGCDTAADCKRPVLPGQQLMTIASFHTASGVAVLFVMAMLGRSFQCCSFCCKPKDPDAQAEAAAEEARRSLRNVNV